MITALVDPGFSHNTQYTRAMINYYVYVLCNYVYVLCYYVLRIVLLLIVQLLDGIQYRSQRSRRL